MIKLFKPLTSLRRLYKKTKSLRLAYRLLPWQATSVVRPGIRYKNGNIIFEGQEKQYSAGQVALFQKQGELLSKFLNAGNISFVTRQPEAHIVSILLNGKDLKINVNNPDNLKVVEEIFIDQLYDFHSSDQYVVCDVGMNIAAASLYFASFDNVEKVYGYEPFKDTFDLASQNVSLNEQTGNKIVVNNYGLGAKDQVLKVPKPSQGASGGTTSDFVIAELKDTEGQQTTEVVIKDICSEIQNIKARHPERKLILKLDCEGAEYEIIDVLKDHKMISLVDIYMIEYHFKGKKIILDILQSHGFLVMSPGSDDISFYGMLYAIKK